MYHIQLIISMLKRLTYDICFFIKKTKMCVICHLPTAFQKAKPNPILMPYRFRVCMVYAFVIVPLMQGHPFLSFLFVNTQRGGGQGFIFEIMKKCTHSARFVFKVQFYWTCQDVNICLKLDTCLRPNVFNTTRHWTQVLPFVFYF